jgi:hypothetical protein
MLIEYDCIMKGRIIHLIYVQIQLLYMRGNIFFRKYGNLSVSWKGEFNSPLHQMGNLSVL